MYKTRYERISQVESGICPVCGRRGDRVKRDQQYFFWVIFNCSCGYELREHVLIGEKEENTNRPLDVGLDGRKVEK